MRTIIIAAALLVGTTPAIARHHHYRHGVHRHLTERHHHREVANKTTQSGTQLQGVEDHPAARKATPASEIAPNNVDPEALAWATPKEHFDDRPRKMIGKLVVGDKIFPFVSGGHGWSIPWGHWPVTPNEVGSWGSRHGAIGLNNGDDIPDPKLHRGREGVEIHAAERNTAGCVGIREHYGELKKMVLGMVERFGHAWLHVTPQAVAITPSRYLAGRVGEVVAAKDDDGEELKDATKTPLTVPTKEHPPHHRSHRHHTRMASR